MKPLPRALFFPSRGFAPSTGAFVIVETQVAVETLRGAIARGAVGIALSGCRTGADIQRLAVLLSVAEALEDRAEGGTSILALTDGILPAPLSAESVANKTPRLAALVWDKKVLAKNLGVADDHNGDWTGALAAASAAVLLTAAAAGVPAYDAASERDADSFAADCQRSRGAGFFGRVALNEPQVSVIETVYAR